MSPSHHDPTTMDAEERPTSTAALVAALIQLYATSPKAVRANVHDYPASIYANDDESSTSTAYRDRKITSWKLTEHMLLDAKNSFPTFARGLFTEEMEDDDELPAGIERDHKSRDRIVARGYDKFFSPGEVAWTKWSSLQIYTQPPFHLTLKSNGCLILIAALSPSHLIVTSKHSLGTAVEPREAKKPDETDNLVTSGLQKLTVDDQAPIKDEKNGKRNTQATALPHMEPHSEQGVGPHPAVGRRWLKRTLDAKGRTESELAQRLWDMNSTAVLELCDDSFEEHVIATPPYWTGLHLHGLNHNTPQFLTAPPSEVDAFASYFGFIPTKYVELQTLNEVKAFTDDVANTGSWEGDQIEGFVVRCTVRAGDNSTSEARPPYHPGAPFFFKIKFEEPYLLYRQWREITRLMLPLLNSPSPKEESAVWQKVRSKAKRPEVKVYADWCGRIMKVDPESFEDYDRGVVKVRDKFLEWIDEEGATAWSDARTGKGNAIQFHHGKGTRRRAGRPQKWILIPIAVPGCGKTLVGLALSQLFGFGHTQTDDVTTKKTGPTFLNNIAELLQKDDVVFADRNNHMIPHYEAFAKLQDVKSLRSFSLNTIAIVWDLESEPYSRILSICADRVEKRGDNHQTLRPDPNLFMAPIHRDVIGDFLRRWTAPDPTLFDKMITLQIVDSPRIILGKVVDGLVEVLGLDRPSDQAIDDALKAAGDYKVTTPYHPSAKAAQSVRYFGLSPEVNLPAIMKNVLPALPAEYAESARTTDAELKSANRYALEPHITLVHEKNVLAEREALGQSGSFGVHTRLWETCKTLAESKLSPMYAFDITYLVWDDRVMAFAVENLRPSGVEANIDLPEDVMRHLHVTVGTTSETIPAYESMGITRIARARMDEAKDMGEAKEAVDGSGPVKWVKMVGLKGEGRIKGMH